MRAVFSSFFPFLYTPLLISSYRDKHNQVPLSTCIPVARSFIRPASPFTACLSFFCSFALLSFGSSPLLFLYYKRYPWLQLAGEERKAAVAERRTVLLTQILALDAPAGDQGYVCARVCASVRPLLQERRAMESGERKKR